MKLFYHSIMLFGWLITLIFCLSSCEEKKARPLLDIDTRDSSTIEMAKELGNIYESIRPEQSIYKNTRRAVYFYNQGKGKDFGTKMNLEYRAAFEELQAGNTPKALEEFERILEVVKNLEISNKDQIILEFQTRKALAYIRLGEQENCIINHNENSCIFPLQKQAFHKSKRGSENAIQLYQSFLENEPDNFTYKYLLNVAYMTLGIYPDHVPEQYLIPLLHPEKNHIPRFKNIASHLSIDDSRLSGGVIIDDFNNDGYYDLIVSSWNLTDQLKYYVNNGDGSFIQKQLEAGLKGITGGLYINHMDYNNDGNLDLFISRGAWLGINKFPNSLIRNNGDGSFTDVTRQANIYSKRPTQAVTWSDFNNDGFLDCFIGNESGNGKSYPSELFLNQKDGTFIEIGSSVGAQYSRFMKGVATSDFDNDGDQDIFISVLGSNNLLLRNDQSNENKFGFIFTEIGEIAGITEPAGSFPCWFFDVNNDGWDDIFVSGYSLKHYGQFSDQYTRELLDKKYDAPTPRLYINQKDGTFKDKSEKFGLNTLMFAMGANFGDLNNDGYLDFYVSTGEPDYNAIIPNRMFLNIGGTHFDEVTAQGGFGHIQKGHAISFADLDNDGDQDVYAVMGGAYEGDVFYNALFENPISDNHWVKIKLEGIQSNKAAFGAKVKIVIDEENTQREIYRTLSSGSSFGEHPTTMEIGVGKATLIKSIEILWPSGQKQVFEDMEVNKMYNIKEGTSEFSETKLIPIKFNSEGPLKHSH